MLTVHVFVAVVEGKLFAASSEDAVRAAVRASYENWPGADVLGRMPVQRIDVLIGGSAVAATVAAPRVTRDRVVRFPAGVADYDAALRAYNEELAAAGWDYEESEMSDEAAAALARTLPDVAKLRKNYDTGVITGGEFDMKVAELRGLIQ